MSANGSRPSELGLARLGFDHGLDSSSVAAAALTVQPFVLCLLAMQLFAPPTKDAWRHADPILQILPRALTTWLVPILGIVLALAWSRAVRPTRDAIVPAVRRAALGALAAVVVVGVLRAVAGPKLPGLIPPEESAAPGLTLNMTAGLVEELLFRLVALPGVFLLAARRTSTTTAATLAIVVTGVAFALLHQAGPGQSSPTWFLTRLVVPGCAMSLAAVRLGTSFMVTAHCTAHVLIPVLFA